jgi:hypothetical protein
MFGRPVRIDTYKVDLSSQDTVVELLGTLQPTVVVQAASLQAGSVIASNNSAWARLVAEGGLSATAVFQALLTSRLAKAVLQASPRSQLINCCFPDVANSIVAGMTLPVACGIGNIAILAHAFAGMLSTSPKPKLQMLCHYQNITPWRRPMAERSGPAPRVWLDGREIGDIYDRFAAVQLTPEPVIDISGASGIPLMLAMASKRNWSGHVPGPGGLPGGYPVRLKDGHLELDLPAGLDRNAAVAWNVGHEAANGLVVDEDGYARYTGRLHDCLRAESPDVAAGFHVRDLEEVGLAMADLRKRMQGRSS